MKGKYITYYRNNKKIKVPMEIHKHINDDESYEEFRKEKEEQWIKQGGGKIDFGEGIGVIDFLGNKEKEFDDFENLEIQNRYVFCCSDLEMIRRKIKADLMSKENITSSPEWTSIKKLIKEQELLNKEWRLSKESFNVSNIEELKDIMERYRKDKFFRKNVETTIPTPNKIGETLSMSVYTSQGFFISSGGTGGGGTTLNICGDKGYNKGFTFPLKNIIHPLSPNQKECFENIVEHFEESIFLTNPTTQILKQ